MNPVMNNGERIIEKILNEYNKYIISRIIKKDYDFSELRNLSKQLSENTEFIKYDEDYSNQEVVKNINYFIRNNMYEKFIKFE